MTNNLLKINRSLLMLSALILFNSCGSARKIRERKIDTVISTARSFTGTPYKWGGTTRSGMDCSGLLINSFNAIDFPIPRTSEAQSKLGKKVKIDQLKKGDLVFFATGKKKRKITHVGLVTDIRGREKVTFIHSSSSLGVVETDIYSDYFFERFRYGRRILK